MLAHSSHRLGVDFLEFQNDLGPAERVDFPARADRLGGIPRFNRRSGLFKPLSDALGRQSRFAVPGAKKRDRCLTHSDSSCGSPRNMDRRGMDQRGSLLRRRSADGLVGCRWRGDLHRGRTAREKLAVVAIGWKRLGLRQAQGFVFLANGRIGLSAELNR